MKKYFGLFFILATISYLDCFEWPQLVENQSSIFAWFGENRGSSFCSALLFSDADTVHASDEGLALAILGTNSNEDGWFSSTLGNTVILAHKNQMNTVYGNLESIDIVDSTTKVKSGDILGKGGSSGWQKGKSCLEFQVLDTKLEAIINPLLLLEKKDIEHDFLVMNLKAKNRTTGLSHTLSNTLKIPPGVYALYCNREPGKMPYKITTSINGIASDTITYNMLVRKNNRLCLQGKRPYQFTEIYPEEGRFMLAEIILTYGKNTLAITTNNSLGKEKKVKYHLEVK
ncbi:MAG TPA: peptidoglycan DD-metalloendopeptidase family protein [Treponemataceae bacterium]|nr:peptidoglycan DD-metalloendopeptidase family protein [Treponemataceae bacterium]